MKKKAISIYHYEKRGLIIAALIMLTIAVINGYATARPQWLPINSSWLILLCSVAAVIITFVVIMHKRVNRLKKYLYN